MVVLKADLAMLKDDAFELASRVRDRTQTMEEALRLVNEALRLLHSPMAFEPRPRP